MLHVFDAEVEDIEETLVFHIRSASQVLTTLALYRSIMLGDYAPWSAFFLSQYTRKIRLEDESSSVPVDDAIEEVLSSMQLDIDMLGGLMTLWSS